ncbi:hypothetical protein ACFC5T_16315 [Streptomyces sp. NPDC055961]|uniref:hypothetical protein n=1 Tax=Streptomyces sp. NPDC055961 TaxID=3345666 RepID=UPI0035DA985C
MNRPPLAAHYGLGVIFPVVVLDSSGWKQAAPWARPQRTTERDDLLVLRWSGLDQDEDESVQLLVALAQLAPDPLDDESALAAYAEQLPRSARLIALRPSALIGSWAERPGQQQPTAGRVA